MNVSLSDLKVNVGKYVKMAEENDIYITRNGKRVAKLTSAESDKKASLEALIGLLPNGIDIDQARTERYK